MAKRSKTRKPYEKRYDLTPYRRLLRFVRWMSPTLSAEDVLQMLLNTEKDWHAEHLARHASLLESAAMEDGNPTLAELVPAIVIGRWHWPSRRTGAWLQARFYSNDPVLLEGKPPTSDGLWHLAQELRETLDLLLQHGPWFITGRIKDALEGGVIQEFFGLPQRGQPMCFYFFEMIANNNFRVYCFWLLARLLVDGQVWRLGRCRQCGVAFLKTRRDPPDRPSRFCSDQCRRGWHNPRRPMKGNPQ